MCKNKSSCAKAILILMMIFALGAVLGLTAYMLNLKKTPDVIIQPKPDEPADPSPSGTPEIDISNWKTYKNEEYGFEIKYPQDWFVEDSKSATITTIILAIIGTREKPDYIYSHGLFNSETDAFVAIHVSEERLDEPIDRFGGAGTRKEIGALDNAETMKEYDGEDIIRYVIKNDKIIFDFEITFPSNPEKKARAESMIENILLTFEFIKI